jgi:hypothetical protein
MFVSFTILPYHILMLKTVTNLTVYFRLSLTIHVTHTLQSYVCILQILTLLLLNASHLDAQNLDLPHNVIHTTVSLTATVLVYMGASLTAL